MGVGVGQSGAERLLLEWPCREGPGVEAAAVFTYLSPAPLRGENTLTFPEPRQTFIGPVFASPSLSLSLSLSHSPSLFLPPFLSYSLSHSVSALLFALSCSPFSLPIDSQHVCSIFSLFHIHATHTHGYTELEHTSSPPCFKAPSFPDSGSCRSR